MAPNIRQTNAEATRRALLAAARQLFDENGYEATGVDEIASRAGATRGAVYHHFENKRALMVALLDELQAELRQQVIAATAHVLDPRDRIMAAVGAFLDAVTEPGVGRIVMEEAPAAVGWDTWREIDARHYLGLTKAVVAELQEVGHLGPGDPEVLADLLMGALAQAGRLLVRDPSAEGRARVEQALTSLLAGIGPLDDTSAADRPVTVEGASSAFDQERDPLVGIDVDTEI